MIDYSKFTTTPAIPEASSMIETFRAIGYSIETAIADIVDNSISASAKNIWINFEWKGADTWLSIKDDGCGMDNKELIQAMKPGSRNPLELRNNTDLGRFGLGLKTASFSQGRKLSVVSKKEGSEVAFWTWDLDFVNRSGKWELINYLPQSFENKINLSNSGTIVIWNDIDRLVKDRHSEDKKALNNFLIVMEQVKKHLAMVFHRFIEQGKIKIYFQDRIIKAWDPFIAREPATQGFPEEFLQNEKVIIKGFILPHKSKINEETYKDAEGAKGWNGQQGFYIYRNERLLLAGDWLGMFRKEEHYKLARIQIDLPNNLDSEWQIDIKKSIARPPIALRDQIRAYAVEVRAQAVEVYRHKGKNVKTYPGQKFTPLWLEHKRGDKWFHRINREHSLIEKIKEMAKSEPDKAIESLIRFIEETIPVKSIYIKEAEEPEIQGKPFEGAEHEPIKKMIQQIYDKLIIEGKSEEQAKAILSNLEPFNHFLHFFEFIN